MRVIIKIGYDYFAMPPRFNLNLLKGVQSVKMTDHGYKVEREAKLSIILAENVEEPDVNPTND